MWGGVQKKETMYILYLGLNPDWGIGKTWAGFIWVEGGMRRKEFDTNIYSSGEF